MKRRRILLLLALLVVAAGVVLFWMRGPKEPVYEGKGIAFWIMQTRAPGTPEAFQNARKALLATSADSRRFLMSQFTRRDPKWLASFRVWLDNKLGRNTYAQSELQRMQVASFGLQLLGSEITPVLPTLAEYLGDGGRGRIAAWVMSKAGDAAIPYLMNGIASANSIVVENAEECIVLLARESEAILPTLFQWLRHTNGTVRRVAVRGLGIAGSQPYWLVPPLSAALSNSIVTALSAALSDPESLVQWQAALALGDKGAAARPAVPALLRLMTNSSLDVARTASNAVFCIAPTALPQRTP